MIKIQNIYYMLAYAFRALQEKGYSFLSAEEFDNVHNLLASILSKGISNQIKRGLGREYVIQQDLLGSPQGKIIISGTLKQFSCTKKLVCEYDEFTENAYMNQILKSVALTMIRSDEVDRKIKKSLRKSLALFQSVDTVKLSEIKWRQIQASRNNTEYRMLLNICYLIVNGLLVSENKNTFRFYNIFDEQRMCRLYERFILEYYKRHYSFLKPASSHISWSTDNGVIDFLPQMRSDITLRYNGFTLIIDAKYYQKSLQTGLYGKKTIHSGNLYQIYTYVKNQDKDESGNVSGLLLYAKTDDEDFCPSVEYSLGGNKLKVSSLDLNDSFENIAYQLDSIVYNWQKELRNRKTG